MLDLEGIARSKRDRMTLGVKARRMSYTMKLLDKKMEGIYSIYRQRETGVTW